MNLALDPDTYDLSASGGLMSTVEGVEEAIQRCRVRLRVDSSMWSEDWSEDGSSKPFGIGIPYSEIASGFDSTSDIVQGWVKSQMLQVPGIVDVEIGQVSYDTESGGFSMEFSATYESEEVFTLVISADAQTPIFAITIRNPSATFL